MTAKKRPFTTLNLSTPLVDKIRAIAKKEDRPVANLVGRVLKLWLEDYDRSEKFRLDLEAHRRESVRNQMKFTRDLAATDPDFGNQK